MTDENQNPEAEAAATPAAETQTTETAPVRNPEDWLSEHFSVAELTRSATAAARGIDNTPDARIRANLTRVADTLEKIRAFLSDKYGKPMPVTVTSGYRCPKLNRAIGGSDKSAHMQGLAADIKVAELTVEQLARDIKTMMNQGLIKVDQLIQERPRNGGRWVHVGLAQGTHRGQLLTYEYSKAAGKNVYKQGLLA